MKYIITRLQERSTWLGLIALAAGLGLGVDPALAEYIISIGVSLAGLVGVVTPDKAQNNDDN